MCCSWLLLLLNDHRVERGVKAARLMKDGSESMVVRDSKIYATQKTRPIFDPYSLLFLPHGDGLVDLRSQQTVYRQERQLSWWSYSTTFL